MKKNIVATSVRQAHRIETVAELSINTLKAAFAADGVQVNAAKSGRKVIEQDHIKRRAQAAGRFGSRVLLDVAGILPLDMYEVMPKVVGHLLQLQQEAELAELGLNTFISSSWGWGSYNSNMLAAFSYKAGDSWVACTDEASIINGIGSIPQEEWMARGFWDALRWLIDNHEGVQVVNDSEFFKVETLSDLFKIRGQLSWWASFSEQAQKSFAVVEERLMVSEAEYALSGGTNTHYVGEAQAKWEDAGKRLEKANEAADLMENDLVLQFIDDLCMVFELAGKEEPQAGEYSAEKEFQKQLASMDSAAATAMDSVRTMIAAAIAKGSITA